MPENREKKNQKLRQNSSLFKGYKKAVFKVFALLIAVCLNWTGFSSVSNTFAHFTAEPSLIEDNVFNSGTLSFSLRSGQDNFSPINKAKNMKPGDVIARDIYVKKEGTAPFKYTAMSVPSKASCDLDLYNVLHLKVWYNYYTDDPQEPNYHQHRTMALKYDGLLKDFDLRALDPNDPDLQIPNSHPYFENIFYEEDEHWLYATEIILPENISSEIQNKSCQFDLVFTAWQVDFESPEKGFTAIEEITSSVATGDWSPQVEIIYPVGGETWYLIHDGCPNSSSCSAWCISKGMNANCQYAVQWEAVNSIGPDEDLLIDLYFSNNSGNTWIAKFAEAVPNTGEFLWKPPFHLDYATSRGRIKAVATHKDYPFLQGEDMSEDFCPPMIDFEEFESGEVLDTEDQNTENQEEDDSAQVCEDCSEEPSVEEENSTGEDQSTENQKEDDLVQDCDDCSLGGNKENEENTENQEKSDSAQICEDCSEEPSVEEENSTGEDQSTENQKEDDLVQDCDDCSLDGDKENENNTKNQEEEHDYPLEEDNTEEDIGQETGSEEGNTEEEKTSEVINSEYE